MIAGYSATPLWKKLGLKPGSRYTLYNAPGFDQQLKGLPDDAKRLKSPRANLDLIVLFCKNRSVLERRLPGCKKLLASAGMLWIAWPKKSSGVKTDLDFGVVQKSGLRLGLVDNKVAAVDDTWSGLRFVYRLKDRR